jgi:hypothetical protein
MDTLNVIAARSLCFELPKEGNSASEYEDAQELITDERGIRCAVADGAAESLFAGVWARLLVHSYCTGQLTVASMETALHELQQEWMDYVASRTLPWYAEEKARNGAFAALVGLNVYVTSDGERQVHAMAVGDSCLFHVRSGVLISAFPLTRSVDFSISPFLLSSRDSANTNISDRLISGVASWLPEDRFYLMTDALSCWFLRDYENDGNCVSIIESIEEPEHFLSEVQRLRSERAEDGTPRMRNDDVTLLKITMS